MTAIEIIETNRGKPCLLLDGYTYRLHRKRASYTGWLCINEKQSKCHGKLKVYVNGQMVLTQPHRCVPNIAVTEIRKKMYVCKKRAREEITVPVSQIFKEEFQEVLSKGYDMVADMPIYDNVKSSLCKVRREALDAAGLASRPAPDPESDNCSEGYTPEPRPLPEIVEYRTEQPTVTQSIQVDPQPTVMEKIKMTKRILDKSKAAPVASSSAAEPASRSFADVGQVGQAASSASPVVEPARRGFSCGGRPLEKRPRNETAVDDDFDDDKMFLLSLCGKMKHLSPANNMQFRLGVQQLLFDLLRSESQTNLQNGSRSGNAFYTPATAQINPVSSSSVSSFSEVLIKEEVEETLTDESPLMVDESFPDEVKTEENSTERYSDNSGNMDYN